MARVTDHQWAPFLPRAAGRVGGWPAEDQLLVGRGATEEVTLSVTVTHWETRTGLALLLLATKVAAGDDSTLVICSYYSEIIEQ